MVSNALMNAASHKVNRLESNQCPFVAWANLPFPDAQPFACNRKGAPPPEPLAVPSLCQ
jgi:hypothetical protein